MTTPVQTMTSSMNYFDSNWNNLEEFAVEINIGNV